MNPTAISPERAHEFCGSCRFEDCACECHSVELVTCEDCGEEVPEAEIQMLLDDALCGDCLEARTEVDEEPDYRDGDFDEEELQA